MFEIGHDETNVARGRYEGLDFSELVYADDTALITKNANVLDTKYEDNTFDLIICCQFLHHVHEDGFKPYIKEYYRILKHNGVLVILEPSNFYPFYWVITQRIN